MADSPSLETTDRVREGSSQEDNAPPKDPPDASPEGSASELEMLQELLFGSKLEDLSQHTAESVAAVLPQAVLKADRDKLTPASVALVESAIRTSVRQDLKVLSDALFPVIGPAARKSISVAIDNLIQSFNQTLDRSLSPKSFQWRVEAWRTGRSFAEVALLHTLVYQVEQVLLIHKETGLLLQHVVGGAVAARDPDVVSAMLTAIRDFAKDSFSLASGDSLDTLELGDFHIWLEEGPQAAIACVIRGTAPQELRETLRDTIEKVHLLFDVQMQAFEGDELTLAESKPYLEDCLQAQFVTTRADPTAVRWRRIRRWTFLGGVAVALLAWAAVSYRTQRHWTRYVSELQQQPGIVVTRSGRRQGKFYLEGLRDPSAADPAALLAATPLKPDSVSMAWEPYLSVESSFLAERVQTWLNPPPTATLTLDPDRGILYLTGSAPVRWIREARRLGLQMGLQGWDDTELVSTEQLRIGELVARIEQRQFNFVPGQSQLQAPDRIALRHQAEDLLELFEIARSLGKTIEVTLTGLGDRGARPSLGEVRARILEHALVHQGIPDAVLTPEPSTAPPITDNPGESAIRFTANLKDAND